MEPQQIQENRGKSEGVEHRNPLRGRCANMRASGQYSRQYKKNNSGIENQRSPQSASSRVPQKRCCMNASSQHSTTIFKELTNNQNLFNQRTFKGNFSLGATIVENERFSPFFVNVFHSYCCNQNFQPSCFYTQNLDLNLGKIVFYA